MKTYEEHMVRRDGNLYEYDGGEAYYKAEELREMADKLDEMNDPLREAVLAKKLVDALAVAPYLRVKQHSEGRTGFCAIFHEKHVQYNCTWGESGHGHTPAEAIIEAADIFTGVQKSTKRKLSEFEV